MDHCSIISKNKEYIDVISAIQAGIFQFVVSTDTSGALTVRTNEYNQIVLKVFNRLCIEIMEKSMYSNQSFYVYRALFNIPENPFILPHPVPFSTTLSLPFAEDWLYGYNNGRVVLKILIDAQPFVKIDNDFEREVILPSGDIKIHSLDCVIDNTRYYTCSFAHYGIDGSRSYLNSNINNIGMPPQMNDSTGFNVA